MALVNDLRKEFGNFGVALNPSVPRRGSFECIIKIDGKEDVTVWTGLEKGPPRTLKFPESDVVAAEIKKLL